MPKMREDLLHFVWAHRLIGAGPFMSVSGSTVIVHAPGSLNRDAGPDFSEAQISVNGVRLAGNVEIHVRTSDWLRHGHQNDPRYSRIILHVVFKHDTDLPQNTDNGVQVLEINSLIDPAWISFGARAFSSSEPIPCGAMLHLVPDEIFSLWVRRMSAERLEKKVAGCEAVFEKCERDYSQTFYTLLLRSYGVPVNGLPFEMLAAALPFRLLLRHAGELKQLEALLLGTASLLNETDVKHDKLRGEFAFLSAKYGIKPLPPGIIKHSRMRHASSPNVRLTQFATLVHTQHRAIVHPEQLTEMAAANTLCDRSSLYENVARGQRSAPGKMLHRAVIVNALVPFLVFYGRKTGQSHQVTRATDLLEICDTENNRITRYYDAKAHAISGAAMSQGLLHLYDAMCTQKKCLSCGIGSALLKKQNNLDSTSASSLSVTSLT